jgi:serine protease
MIAMIARMRKLRFAVPAVAVALVALAAAAPAGAAANSQAKPTSKPSKPPKSSPSPTPTPSPASTTGQPPLQYQSTNGPVETAPVVYLVFWGEQWAVGWQDVSNSGNVYTSGQAQTYITDFFQYLSSTPTSWNAVPTQYCQGVAVNATSCPGGDPHVGNPPVFGGTWVDTTSPPPPPVVPDNCVVLACVVPGTTADAANLLAAEAVRAEQHFGYNANADYMLMLPEATTTTGVLGACAYHSQAQDSQGRWISYTNMPYVMNSNVLCGENFVNSDTAFGNGFFDGYSIVAGHEFSEAETDALPFTNPAWRDSAGQENGDKCAWLTPGTPGGAHDIGPDSAGHVYAVQTTWSNSAGGCAA